MVSWQTGFGSKVKALPFSTHDFVTKVPSLCLNPVLHNAAQRVTGNVAVHSKDEDTDLMLLPVPMVIQELLDGNWAALQAFAVQTGTVENLIS